MEPVTTIISSAIALGAAAGLKPTVEKAIKDAYEGLKRIIQDRYAANEDVTDALDYVAKKPEAEKRRASLDDALSEAGAESDEALVAAAEQVHQAVQAHDPGLPESIGMRIRTLKAKDLAVEDVQAGAAGIAVDVGVAEIEGTASFKGIGGGGPRPK